MAKGGSFDFKDLEKLQKQIERLEAEREGFNRECTQELAARLLRKVTKRTPVGKAPKLDGPKTVKVKGSDGKSKAFLSRNGAIIQKYWAGYVGGTLRRGWTVGDIQRIGDSYQVEIINPTEYASYVEYGHRQTPGRYIPALGVSAKKAWVPGKFMLTISEKEIKALAPKLIEKKLETKLREVFDA
ncbi:Uncharacterised protein [uncultured Clostridium sp.]|nr:Uncharacterised protein [uncultured Clostridium sp.]DAQ37230.1 MAG TPA: type I neck protein [Caudoviricetes sp.]